MKRLSLSLSYILKIKHWWLYYIKKLSPIIVDVLFSFSRSNTPQSTQRHCKVMTIKVIIQCNIIFVPNEVFSRSTPPWGKFHFSGVLIMAWKISLHGEVPLSGVCFAKNVTKNFVASNVRVIKKWTLFRNLWQSFTTFTPLLQFPALPASGCTTWTVWFSSGRICVEFALHCSCGAVGQGLIWEGTCSIIPNQHWWLSKSSKIGKSLHIYLGSTQFRIREEREAQCKNRIWSAEMQMCRQILV